ncbi:hypothetical protein [Streptomyces sp. NBC_00582]|uniref:hypothetical protein n=1 Tax=Streptomyces sp. NBC_00582 TaxID=2975783 RepID=UPI002E8041F5|nr:hypothetical protein [Streptomyces sp. NBC_00582]WUB64729.1 hypothetical protein OG852_32155 [Streptomyces sp. NBC_00582]
MSALMRAPVECASWEWELDAFAQPGLDSALMTAVRMSSLLRDHGLMEPDTLKWQWLVAGRGSVGVTTGLALRGKLNEAELAQRIQQCRPVGFPDAEIGALTMSGTGTWIDAGGTEHSEPDLVGLTVYADERHLAAEVAVFHDVWGYCDFGGVPHPDVQRRNAPRLAAALQELELMLGAAAEPGDPTYFGRAEGYGLEMPDLIDGLGPDLTDML